MGSAFLNRIVKQAVGDAQGWVHIQRVMSFWPTISLSLMLRGAAAIAFVVNGARYSIAEDGAGLGKADARARGVAGEVSG